MVVNSIAFKKGDERLRVGLMQAQFVDRHFDRDIARQRHELLRDADEFDGFRIGQRLAPLRLLDFGRAREQRIKIAIVIDELRRRLDADAACAGHIIGRIARERLHIDDLVRRNAEIVEHFGFR